MLKRFLIAALAALLPLAVSASCMTGDNWPEVASDHYAYWKTTDGETWVSRYDECWITVEDPSYHNTLEEALACGDAVEAQTVMMFELVVYFPTDVHVIDAVQLRGLSDVIAHFRANGINASEAIVQGHTDSTHTDAYNMALGERRAASLRDALGHLGIETLRETSYGESEPVADNATATGRADNRRAEATLAAVVTFIIRK